MEPEREERNDDWRAVAATPPLMYPFTVVGAWGFSTGADIPRPLSHCDLMYRSIVNSLAALALLSARTFFFLFPIY
jgi:hypothetical protein